jgi:predicted CopG family antitoxin
MATKTISLRLEAYEKLKRARRYREESFSEVVLRARWPEESTTGAALLARYREHGPFFTDDELAAVEGVKREDRPPKDKWAGR